MSQKSVSTSYDVLPYPPYSFPATHISRLGAIGHLFGLSTAQPSQSRVLELGCGIGANTLAMAQNFPDAEFIGVDASEKQIGIGLEIIKSSNLSNVRLLSSDLSNLPEDLGHFDYIISHGLYSWVSQPVQDAILRISRENLKPTGVAYVSYNCLPGWRMRGALRDMMLMHTGGIENPLQKVQQSKALVKFLAESCAQDTPYGRYLAQELDLIAKCDDSYIAHEFLEQDNEALYFTDFIKEAARHKLLYLGDAEPATMVADNLPAQAAATLKSLNLNLLATEQYMDFVRNRMFRGTLLCHMEASLQRNVNPSRIKPLFIQSLVSQARPWSESQPALFKGVGNTELSVQEQTTAETFSAVAQIPREGASIQQLMDDLMPALIARHPQVAREAIEETLGRILLQGYFKKMVDFTLGPVAVASSGSPNPTALPLARWQAAHGLRLSTRRLEMLNADPFVAKLISFCDGSRNRDALLSAMIESHESKEYQLNESNQAVSDPQRAKIIIERLLDGALENVRQLGLLLPAA